MKLKTLLVTAITVGAFGMLCNVSANNETTETATTEATTTQLKHKVKLEQSDVVRISEALGHLIGRNLENPAIEFNLDAIVKGMRDASAGLDAPMSDEEYEEVMASIQESAFNDLANSNLDEANEFLTSNSAETGIQEVIPGKLQYRVVNEGDGSEVSEATVPTLHYVGSFIDGTVFGSSHESGGPITLPLDQTIPGFSKGILGMKSGEKRRIYVHPELGYGISGHLPPNSLLIFDVEVVSVDANGQPVAENDTAKEESVK